MLRRSLISSPSRRHIALVAIVSGLAAGGAGGGGCVKQDASQRPPAERHEETAPAASAAATAPPATGTAPAPAAPASAPASGQPYYACRHTTSDVLRQVRDLAIVMDAAGGRRAALADWQAVGPDCRDGRWHLAAALLIGAGKPDRVAADGVTFPSARGALEQGLSAESDSPELLAFIAYGSAVAPADYPPLPADACARLTARIAAAPAAAGGADAILNDEAASARAYVCAHADLRAGKLEPALSGFATAAAYPDALLRQVEILARTGRGKKAHELAAEARTQLDQAGHFGARASEIKALRDALAAAAPP